MQDDREDSGDDSDDEDYYGDRDIFMDEIKFHFKHEDDSGDCSSEDYQDREEYEVGPEVGVAERIMFIEAMGSNSDKNKNHTVIGKGVKRENLMLFLLKMLQLLLKRYLESRLLMIMLIRSQNKKK